MGEVYKKGRGEDGGIAVADKIIGADGKAVGPETRVADHLLHFPPRLPPFSCST